MAVVVCMQRKYLSIKCQTVIDKKLLKFSVIILSWSLQYKVLIKGLATAENRR